MTRMDHEPQHRQPPDLVVGAQTCRGRSGGSPAELPTCQRRRVTEDSSGGGGGADTVIRWRMSAQGSPAGGPGTLGLLATPILKLVFEHLRLSEQMLFRIVSRHFETALATLVTSLSMYFTAQSRLNAMYKSVRTLTRLETVCLSIFDDLPDEETQAQAMEQLLTHLMGGPVLHTLKVYSQSDWFDQLVLHHLGRCTGLTELSLEFNSSHINGDNLTDQQVGALATAALTCNFLKLKTLTLEGWLLSPVTAHAPAGLLTMWDRHPESFTSLERLSLTVCETNVLLVDTISVRLAAMTDKHLRHFQLNVTFGDGMNHSEDHEDNIDTYAAFVAGVCCHAPLLESLKVGEMLWLDAPQLDGVLDIAAPNRGSLLKELRFTAENFTPLAQAMREGRLQQLEVLEVNHQQEIIDEQEEGEVPGLLPLVDCLRQDARTCPRLRVLKVTTGYPLEGDLLAWLWAALGGRQMEEIVIASDRMVDNTTLQRCAGVAMDWSHLQRLDMLYVVMEAATAAAILKAVLRDCPVPSNVSFAATVKLPDQDDDSQDDEDVLSEIYDCLDLDCSLEVFIDNPALAIGIRELSLED